MSKSAISRNFSNQNKLSEEKSKVLTQIKQSYQSGIRYYQAGDLALAEQEFATVIRPILSKSDRKNIYVDVQDCKEEALSSMQHLGKIYLASNQYFNNYAKAAGIFQYCAGFAAKYKIDNSDNYLTEAYLVQDKFLESLDRANNGDLIQKLNNYKQEIEDYKNDLAYIRKEAAERIESIRECPIEEIATRAKVVEEIYKDCANFFVNNGSDKEQNLGLIQKMIASCVKRFFVNNESDKEQNPGLVQKMIASCIKQLGPVPEGCEYSFIGFGSLAGGRMTPWSDLEFGVLINEDKEEYKEYFRNLTKLLHIKVINLGETPLRSLGVEALNNFRTADPQDEWFYDDVLKSGFSFDGPDWYANKLPLGRQGGYKVKTKVKVENGTEQEITINKPDFELILTPKQLAEFQLDVDILDTKLDLSKQGQEQESWYKSDKHLVQSMRLVSLIKGSQNLLDSYRKQLHNIEKSWIMQDRAIKILQEDLESFSLKLGWEEEGKLINVKKDIFRIGDRIIDNLANYYGIAAKKGQPSLNVWEAIDKMQTSGILGSEGAQHLKEALSISTELRLATYCHNQGQNETISTYQPAVEHLNEAQRKRLLEETFYIKDTKILHHFYYVMLRAQKLVQGFCDQEYYNPSNLLYIDRLFDDSNYNKGMVHARFLKYDKALEYMEAAAKEPADNTYLLHDLLFLYNKTANIEKAIKTADKILVMSKDIYMNDLDHPDIAGSYHNLGMTYRDKGEYEETTKYCNKALEIMLKAYKDSPNHPNIALSYNNLGNAYCNKGEYEEAVKYHNKALEIQLKIYKSNLNHPDIATSYNNLGAAYNAKGEYERAIKYYKESLEIRLKAYEHSPNHPVIAASYNNLGLTYNAKGEYEQAIKCYKLSLPIMLKAYEHSPNHPEIATSYNNLGEAYRAKGEYEEAIKYYKESLEIYLKAYKDSANHPRIAISYNNLGLTYEAKGEYQEAIKYYKESLEIYLKAYKDSPNHPEIAISYNNLGTTYNAKGEYQQAIKYFQQSLKIRLKAYKDSPNHPRIAISYNNLGIAYNAKGEYQEAIKYYKESLEIYLKAYKDSPNHPNIAKSYNNLGLVYGAKGEYEEAIRYHKQSLEIMLKAYEDSPNHPDIATSYNNLGLAYSAKGEYEEAIKYYNEALEIKLKAYKDSPNHPDIATSYNNLGAAYYSKGEYEEAIKYYKQSLEIKLKAYKDSPNHPDIAGSYNNLKIAENLYTKSSNIKIKKLSSEGINAHKKQNYSEAIEKYDLALKLVDKILSYKVKAVSAKATLYYNIARSYHNDNNLEQALLNYNQAYQLNDKHNYARDFYKCAKTLYLQSMDHIKNDNVTAAAEDMTDVKVLGNIESL
jgi:tetratricopeptide (TPR) repeat protein